LDLELEGTSVFSKDREDDGGFTLSTSDRADKGLVLSLALNLPIFRSVTFVLVRIIDDKNENISYGNFNVVKYQIYNYL